MIRSESIPILRSFESDGKKFIYGYGALFTSPDLYGTVMTKEVAVASEKRLRKFPAVRWMHKVPFGQLVWDREVEGLTTHIDDIGVHLLVRVYEGKETEWNMIREGGWGFSYGFMPADPTKPSERRCFDFGCFPAFVNGLIYEFSAVDSPAHEDAVAHVIRRMIGNVGKDITNGEIEMNKEESTKRLGFRGMLDSVSPPAPESKPETRAVRSGVVGMLEEACAGSDSESSSAIVTRDFGFSQLPEERRIAGDLPEIGYTKCNLDCHLHPYCGNFQKQKLCTGFEPIGIKKRILRNLGFGEMLNSAFPSAPESTLERGFEDDVLSMLRRASQDSDSKITRSFVEPSRKAIPLGFRAMIDDFNRGNDEEAEIQPITRGFEADHPQYGMLAMAQKAFRCEDPITKSEPILRDLQTKIRAILQDSR